MESPTGIFSNTGLAPSNLFWISFEDHSARNNQWDFNLLKLKSESCLSFNINSSATNNPGDFLALLLAHVKEKTTPATHSKLDNKLIFSVVKGQNTFWKKEKLFN